MPVKRDLRRQNMDKERKEILDRLQDGFRGIIEVAERIEKTVEEYKEILKQIKYNTEDPNIPR